MHDECLLPTTQSKIDTSHNSLMLKIRIECTLIRVHKFIRQHESTIRNPRIMQLKYRSRWMRKAATTPASKTPTHSSVVSPNFMRAHTFIWCHVKNSLHDRPGFYQINMSAISISVIHDMIILLLLWLESRIKKFTLPPVFSFHTCSLCVREAAAENFRASFRADVAY